MRRFIAIVLMLLVPFQWSWSAAASLCEHEANGAHFGHHVHKHEASPEVDGPDKGASNGGYHADCHSCHLYVACVGSASSDRHLWPSEAMFPKSEGFLPDPPIESFFRPPLSLAS